MKVWDLSVKVYDIEPEAERRVFAIAEIVKMLIDVNMLELVW